MEWTRSETLALASAACTQCHGMGLRAVKLSASRPCNCVLRSIFRACYARFRQCATKEKHLSRVTLEFSPAGGHRVTWGRKDEEYLADFYLVSKRSLNAEEWKIFSYHFLLGADWRLCCRRLKIDRGRFFHEVYRLEEKLGRIYRELKPYALYPLDEYFTGRTVNDLPVEGGKVLPFRRNSLHERLKVPVKRVA